MTEQRPEFALVIANEHSSRAAQLQKQIGGLTIPTEVIFTTLDQTRMIGEIADRVTDNAVIVSAGGDGTSNLVGNAIMSKQGREALLNDIPFVPLPLGNANDIAHSLNGRTQLKRVLRDGRQAALQPLEITIGNGAPRYAFGYFSAGGTAAAAMQLEAMKGEHGLSQLPREIITAWTATADYPSFKYKSSKKDPLINVSDVMCLRSDRMAKFGRPDTRVTDETFDLIANKSEGRFSTLLKMGALGLGALRGDKVDGVHMTFVSPVKGREPLPIQYDGETASIAWGSDVWVSIARPAYTTLTTKY